MALTSYRTGFMAALISCLFIPAGYSADTSTVILYTPYTKITLAPGQSVDYAIDLINKGKDVVTADLSLSGIPAGWNYNLKAGNYNIRQLSVLPGETKSCVLTLEVPLKVNKGSYRFSITAGTVASLPVTVVVSEQGTFKTEMTTDQSNMQGPTSSNFTFQIVLKNRTADKQNYALMAAAPRGWIVSFTANYKKVTSVEIDANSTLDIAVEVDPPDWTEAKTYKIPIRALTATTSANTELEVAITGSYALELSTPTGLLSASITAGDQKRIEMVVRNTGSVELSDIKFDQASPIGWEVTYDPKSVDKLEPGNSAKVVAIIKASKKAVAGDYVTNIEAKTPEVSSKIALRIAVKTPMIWGWVGIFIILAAAGTVYYLFRKYGRR